MTSWAPVLRIQGDLASRCIWNSLYCLDPLGLTFILASPKMYVYMLHTCKRLRHFERHMNGMASLAFEIAV